jgi:hypothetical protein
LKPSELVLGLRVMFNTAISTFVWGPPGIGKSAVAWQIADSLGIAFIDLRLSQIDPTDLRGIPYPVIEGGVHGMKWSAPLVLPRDLDFDEIIELDEDTKTVKFYNPTGQAPKGRRKIHYCTDPKIEVKAITKGLTAEIVEKELDRVTVVLRDKAGEPAAGKVRIRVTGETKAVLALEELNSAPLSVIAASYELIYNRRIGEYSVPDGVKIVAMGNRETDKGIAFKMATPVANRFEHIELKVDFDDFQTHALEERFHKHVVGFLSAYKGDLFVFDTATASRGFPTPRSWEFVSQILYAAEDMPENVMTGLITGAIGDGTGVKFLEHCKHADDLPPNEEVLSGRLKKFPGPRKPEVSLCYALTTALCYELKDAADKAKANNWKKEERATWLQRADNFLEFMMTNFPPEICIMGAKTAIAVHKLPFDTQRMKHFDTFAGLYKDYIMG